MLPIGVLAWSIVRPRPTNRHGANASMACTSRRRGRPSVAAHFAGLRQMADLARAQVGLGVGIAREGVRVRHGEARQPALAGALVGVEYAPIVQRAAAIIGSAIFLVIAPGTLAVYVPWYLTHWHFAPPLFPIARVLGAALIVAGLPILLDSFARFALQGLGTPAPVMPPKRLVVTGLYRYVRNPM